MNIEVDIIHVRPLTVFCAAAVAVGLLISGVRSCIGAYRYSSEVITVGAKQNETHHTVTDARTGITYGMGTEGIGSMDPDQAAGLWGLFEVGGTYRVRVGHHPAEIGPWITRIEERIWR